jgi:acetyl-CoA carboxylase biotin carboxylase subunit
MRKELHTAAVRLGWELKYRSLGTVEFLLDRSGRYFFIEVNPRIQVEHPVTELVAGVDLVRAQIELAISGRLKWRQDQINMRGWAVEARVLAEDPDQGFLPVTGEITHLREPAGPGIRLDSAMVLGMQVSADYDSLIAKVISWAEDRPAAINRLRRALNDYQIGGIPTDLGFLLQVLESPKFVAGKADTTYLDSIKWVEPKNREDVEREVALAAALLTDRSRRESETAKKGEANNWQETAWREQM